MRIAGRSLRPGSHAESHCVALFVTKRLVKWWERLPAHAEHERVSLMMQKPGTAQRSGSHSTNVG